MILPVQADSSDKQSSMRCGCREATELRGMLARAAEALQQLGGAVRTLQRSGKEADAEGVQEAILQVGCPSQPAGSMTAWACITGKSFALLDSTALGAAFQWIT